MSNGDEDDGKTKRLDDEYFKNIARRAQSQTFDEDKTQLVTQKEAATPAGASSTSLDQNKTRVYRAGSAASHSATPEESGNMEDPPVGWLVATGGPGQGAVLTLGIGMNSVGRGQDSRVAIPFDDQEISRGKSFSVAYDQRNKEFFLLPGEGKTLVYVEGSPVLDRIKMFQGMVFEIGQTTFRFIPLCGDDFTWDSE